MESLKEAKSAHRAKRAVRFNPILFSFQSDLESCKIPANHSFVQAVLFVETCLEQML